MVQINLQKLYHHNLSYGARLRESGASYGSDRIITERLKMYLAGDDQALEFTEVTQDDLDEIAKAGAI
jgi:hypothetical protein